MTAAKKAAKTSRALVVDAAADQMFVRVPLPPEVVALVRKHVDRAGGLFEMGRGVLELVTGTVDQSERIRQDARRLVVECVAAFADVERDVKRVRKRARPKRRR